MEIRPGKDLIIVSEESVETRTSKSGIILATNATPVQYVVWAANPDLPFPSVGDRVIVASDSLYPMSLPEVPDKRLFTVHIDHIQAIIKKGA